MSDARSFFIFLPLSPAATQWRRVGEGPGGEGNPRYNLQPSPNERTDD